MSRDMNCDMFDVVIAGGGMVGAVLANGLARQGKKVACVDPVSLEDAAFGEASDSFDRRATACAMTSVHLFQHLGLWPELVSQAAAIQSIIVSKQGRWGRTRLQATDIDYDAFGYVIPNVTLAQALHRAWDDLADEIAPKAYWGRRVIDAKQHKQAVKVELDDGSSLSAKLLVVADGARSALRKQLGVASQTITSGQMALVCNVKFAKDGAGQAFERFTDHGPLALLPLGGQLYNLVWCGNKAQTEQRLAAAPEEFSALLQRAFGVSLGELIEQGKRAAFALDIVAADQLHAPRSVILGNAAQALHPVAGQGFNLGLRDVASLLDQLEDAADVGANDVIKAYAQSRASDRQQMLALTTQLATATTVSSASALSLGFGLGLAGFGQWPAASKMLALRASGFQAALPSLCLPPSITVPLAARVGN
jgi:2-octaprenyl-6-methoxyphenol hydroxylase